MILPLIAVLCGIAVLVLSADHFVESASKIAKQLSLSSTFVGLTIVSVGTSAPEILVSVNSVINESPGLAVGNAIGSNIANIGLVLGLTMVIFPLVINRKLVRRETMSLLSVTTLVLLLCLDRTLSPVDGLVMLVALSVSLVSAAANSTSYSVDDASSEFDRTETTRDSLSTSWLVFLISLVCLLISSKVLVWGAVSLALSLGVSNHLIGLTIIALGTSLPELAATIASARLGESGIAIGNIIGSNLFNILAVLSIPALFGPHFLTTEVVDRDMPIMVGLTFLVGIALLLRLSNREDFSLVRMGRPLGFVFLSIFSAHYVWLYSTT